MPPGCQVTGGGNTAQKNYKNLLECNGFLK